MKINLRVDRQTSAHVYLTLFLNGVNAGTLTTTAEEAVALRKIILRGVHAEYDEPGLSGDWSGL